MVTLRRPAALVGLAIHLAVTLNLHGDETTDIKRVQRLESMAYSLQQVKVDRTSRMQHRVADRRRHSTRSELHFRFLTCLTDLADNRKDALLLFPVQVTGFKFTARGEQPPKQIVGSDLKKVRIPIRDFLAGGAPKAKIEVPDLEHGSVYNAKQLVRDEVQNRLEWYFPDIDIEGTRKLYRKKIAVKNDHGESLRVWCFYHTRSAAENGFVWAWQPGAPSEAMPVSNVIPPKSTKELTIAGHNATRRPILASRVRIWAEGNGSGRRSLDYRNHDLWLVETDQELDGQRAYYDDEARTYIHEFKWPSGEREFTERVLTFKNETEEPLNVLLRYRGHGSDGVLAWRSARYTLAPKTTVSPRDNGGFRVRASRMYISAASENRKFVKYAESPVWMVDEHEQRRVYKASQIGSFVYVFNPVGEGTANATATVTVESANIQRGTTVLQVASRGDTFRVDDVRDNGWVKVRFGDDDRFGFIQKRYLRLDTKLPRTPPNSKLRKLTIVSNPTNVQLGDHVLTRLPSGREYEVLEEQSGFYRIEFTQGGEKRHGWVSNRDVRIH